MKKRTILILLLLALLLSACASVSGKLLSVTDSVACIQKSDGSIQHLRIAVLTRMDVQRYQQYLGPNPWCTFSGYANGEYTTVSCR